MTPDKLKQIRLSHGWTQAQMGVAMGITREHYNRLERGINPMTKQAEKLAEILADMQETGLSSWDG